MNRYCVIVFTVVAILFGACSRNKTKMFLPLGHYKIISVAFQDDITQKQMIELINKYQSFYVDRDRITLNSNGREYIYTMDNNQLLIESLDYVIYVQTGDQDNSYELFTDTKHIRSVKIERVSH